MSNTKTSKHKETMKVSWNLYYIPEKSPYTFPLEWSGNNNFLYIRDDLSFIKSKGYLFYTVLWRYHTCSTIYLYMHEQLHLGVISSFRMRICSCIQLIDRWIFAITMHIIIFPGSRHASTTGVRSLIIPNNVIRPPHSDKGLVTLFSHTTSACRINRRRLYYYFF